MTTCSADLDLTPSQEKSLEFSLIWLATHRFFDEKHYFSEIGFRQLEDGSLKVWVSIVNGIPGTFGFILPDHFILYIGRRGGIWSYSESSRAKHGFVKKTGIAGLIHSVVDGILL